MKKLLLIAILLMISYSGFAQLINNKINIYAGYTQGSFHGNSLYQSGSFISPSLFPNYGNLSGFSFKGLLRGSQYCSFGMAFDFFQASAWNTEGYSDFSNSNAKLHSFSPTIQLHNKFSERGLYNRLKVFFEAGPSLGLASLTLNNPLFTIEEGNALVESPMSSENTFFGISGRVGLEVILTKGFGVWTSYSFNHNKLSSRLFHDQKFTNSGLAFGVFVRLKKNKRYYY